jgi:hypothetical protein
MPKMTKPQLAKLAKLEAVKEFETQNIYAAAAPRNDVRFNDCYVMASPETQLAYMAAVSQLETFRQEMISAGRAYPGAFGMFTPNWR